MVNVGRYTIHGSYGVHSGKITWQWKKTNFNREAIFKRSIFHYQVGLPQNRAWDTIELMSPIGDVDRIRD